MFPKGDAGRDGLHQPMLPAVAALLVATGMTPSPDPSPPAVTRVSDIAYAGDRADKHRLDLYLPRDRSGAAIVVFVHGGAFLQGDRRDYAFVGDALAHQGFATAVVSYRLSPQTDARGSTQDVAAAVAWIIANAKDYALDPKRLFLAGHSAGAQIVALLGTDASYLARAGIPLTAVSGVFAVAGAYDVRDLSDEPASWQVLDDKIYGSTTEQRAVVSPALHIDRATPRMAVVCGTADDPGSCNRATFFAQALHDAGRSCLVYKVQGAGHMGTLNAFVTAKEPLNDAFTAFTHPARSTTQPP